MRTRPWRDSSFEEKDKLAFVSDMFDRVAPTYDLLNHFISLGNTTIWRLIALTRLAGRKGC